MNQNKEPDDNITRLLVLMYTCFLGYFFPNFFISTSFNVG